MRGRLAVWAGKATGALSRASGRGGGTTLPGDVARAVDPAVLQRLAGELTGGAVLVAGTNGKTTTSRLVTRLLEGIPSHVVANRSGSNLITGVTAAAVAGARLDGHLRADWAVFEVDEASLPAAVAETRPRAVLVGNLFRDQLDRYGELETTALIIQRALAALPEQARTVLNADDPRVGEIGLGLPREPIWYGIDDAQVSAARLPHAADATTCPRCGSTLVFDAVYVGHDGAYRCPAGDFQRPALEVAATDVCLRGLDSLSLRAAGTRLELPLGGLYNAYNVLGAFSLGLALGLDAGYMAARLAGAEAAFGRLERIDAAGRRLTLLLAKNPAGFNEALRGSIELAGGRHFLIALNDRIADGRDVSWIWDVDFELLAGRARSVTVAGTRADDLAVRLKYAGVDGATVPQPDFERALDGFLGGLPEAAEGYVLCTYTAMLDLRRVLAQRGWARPYWAT
ncbi:MAG: MurT ligase domain-containing protein [Candidatus Dormibacteraceae bacterium]